MTLVATKQEKGKRVVGFKWEISAEEIFNNKDPYAAIQSGKIMARAWAKTLTISDHLSQSQSFILRMIESYWQKSHGDEGKTRPMPFLFEKLHAEKLDKVVISVAEAIGTAAVGLPVIEASYLLGNVYTAVLPEGHRATGGIFYTPPALTSRLIQAAEDAGINWATARIVDPACGGGAFLAPVCLKILEALKNREPEYIIKHIQSHLVGWEIDPFGGWLTQVFVELVMKDVLRQAGIKLDPLVRICNSLENRADNLNKFDLVIGNPPYGKVKQTESIKERFFKSLYGHPNLYGLFTHLSIDLAIDKGIIALLTPTSFLSGEYFKNLREFLRNESIPVEINFVSYRKGVFEDVLQETMVAVYKKVKLRNESVKVNQITTLPSGGLKLRKSGSFILSPDLKAPWILPRIREQAMAIKAMSKMHFRLSGWGYQVSTGPLVWNRHKPQLKNRCGADCYPVIWAESVTQDGHFILKSEKKNHNPYFKFHNGDDWLVTKKPCILLQRTTAKEQEKRLVGALLPESLLKNGVVIENHLNMIIPLFDKPVVPTHVLAAFLNTKAVNDAFRTISGSVAVSAYELESLPLPAPEDLTNFIDVLAEGGDQSKLEDACLEIYARCL